MYGPMLPPYCLSVFHHAVPSALAMPWSTTRETYVSRAHHRQRMATLFGNGLHQLNLHPRCHQCWFLISPTSLPPPTLPQLLDRALQLDHHSSDDRLDDPSWDNTAQRDSSGRFTLQAGSYPAHSLALDAKHINIECEQNITAELVWHRRGTRPRTLWSMEFVVSDTYGTSKAAGRRYDREPPPEWRWDRAAWELLKRDSGFGGVDPRAVEGFVRDVSRRALRLLEEATDGYDLPMGPVALDIEHLLAAPQQPSAGPGTGGYDGCDDDDDESESDCAGSDSEGSEEADGSDDGGYAAGGQGGGRKRGRGAGGGGWAAAGGQAGQATGKRQRTLQQAAGSKGGSRAKGSMCASSKRPAAKGKLAKLAEGRTSASKAGLLSKAGTALKGRKGGSSSAAAGMKPARGRPPGKTATGRPVGRPPGNAASKAGSKAPSRAIATSGSKRSSPQLARLHQQMPASKKISKKTSSSNSTAKRSQAAGKQRTSVKPLPQQSTTTGSSRAKGGTQRQAALQRAQHLHRALQQAGLARRR